MILTLAALSRHDSHVMELALGIGLVIQGVALLIRGDKVDVGLSSRRARLFGVGFVLVGGGLVSLAFTSIGVCRRCSNLPEVTDPLLAFMTLSMVVGIWQIWRPRKPNQ